MTDETEAPEAAALDTMPEREITFHDRIVWVRMPRPEQLLVWKRTLVQLQKADVSGWDGHQVMAALERTRKIIDSVLVHDVDKNWLDDEMLDGNIGLVETAKIITQAVEAFTDDDNRADRRAAKKAVPAKKAARKAAPRKRA
jgi:hypothetical protein